MPRMDKLRVGVIGLGMGQAHLQCYEQCEQAEVVAVCDVDPQRLDQVLKTRPHVKGYADYRKMLKMKDLQAVSVALPNYLHCPVTLQALDAGLHVLCEKPMAMNAAEARRMKERAEKAGRTLMMHFNVRFMHASATLKPIMDAGLVGRVYHVTTTYLRRDGYPRPGGWFGQKAKSGGGPMIDLGVHRIDFALYLIGYPRPVSVLANCYDLLARQKLAGLDFDCEDFSAAMVRFEDGATMYVAASWDGFEPHGGGLTMSIRGDKGALFESGGEWTLCRKENGVNTLAQLEQVQPTETAQAHFVRSIQAGTPPHPSAEHGVICMQILDAIYESARTGRPVEIS
jgi:predicted dehydrogenase